MSFTANLKIVRRSEWEAFAAAHGLTGRPAPNTYYGVGLEERISAIKPRQHPFEGHEWWLLVERQDPDPLAEQVVAAIREQVLPRMMNPVTHDRPTVRD